MTARKFMGPREGYVEDLSPAEQRELFERTKRVARQVKSRRRKAAAKSFLEDNALVLAAGAAATLLLFYRYKTKKEAELSLVSGVPRHLSIGEALRLL
jgi:hypothetical protein